MMNKNAILIAVISGFASLLLFVAGVLTGALALPILMATALPIVIASLGWGTRAGFVAAGLATLGCLFTAGVQPALLYAAAFGFPAAYLSHCIGLSRVDEGTGETEWFPVGSVFFRATLYGGLVAAAILIMSGFNAPELSKALAEEFAKLPGDVPPELQDAFADIIPTYVALIPYVAPMSWLFTIGLNLWLGAKIVSKSEKFERQNLSLNEAELPPIVLGIFILSAVAAYLSPPISLLGAALSGSIAMAFIILGFNTVHVLLRSNPSATIILIGLYMLTIFLSVPLFIMFLLGLVDQVFKIRQRSFNSQNNLTS